MTKARRARISKAIKAAEHGNRGEIQVVVELKIPIIHVLKKISLRQRALELFEIKGMTKTTGRTGILIYTCIAENVVEIVCDDGVPVDALELTKLLESVRKEVESNFKSQLTGERLTLFLENLIWGLGDRLRYTSLILAEGEQNPNELPDE
jgi:uncharacterized membrane protein